MSSKDVIIADILKNIKEQQQEYDEPCHLEKPYKHFYMYHFQGIKSFQGINCIFQLEFGFRLHSSNINKFRIVFKIIHPQMDDDCKQVDHLYSNIIGQYPNFDEENISLALDDIKKLLPTLHFNVFRGDFYNSISTYTAVSDFFDDVEGLIFSGDNCCVCREVKVITTTECNHYLCVPCYQQIKLVPDEDMGEKRPCPLCREHITYTSS